MAAGRPIVATDADGLLDVLVDAQTALIVPKRDPPALAASIIDLIDRPDERLRLAQAAREAARQYDIATFVRKMERLYVLLHDVSKATNRKGVLDADLSFLSAGVLA
jgi:glycosyltransferase involved in cell wall biosynthesis